MRIGVSALVYLVLTGVIGALLGLFVPSLGDWLPSELGDPRVLGANVAVALLYSAALAHPVMRSRWLGRSLAAATFVALAGIIVVLPWIELVIFNLREVPADSIGPVFILHLITFAAFAPIVVRIFGRHDSSGGAPAEEENRRLRLTPWSWTWRLPAISFSYVLLYVLFGVFVAWRAPAIREFYENVQMPSIGTILLTQVGRGLIWAAIAMPIVRMMRGPRWETALTLGVLFSVLMSAGLLMPNPILPVDVRMVHLVEVSASNFLFGLVVGWLLTPGYTIGRSNPISRPGMDQPLSRTVR
ncbi:MAG: hypothetical protein ABFS34_05165 [Gemmatimonadota bacterium]